ncbi:MAG: FAD:protein FMN transferase [Candidatus Aminicenantes bacterium]|nr:FAD:protein FMN transferase [Candidatus Aminicenantes bacterium]
MKKLIVTRIFFLLLLGSLFFTHCRVQEKWHTASFFFFDTLCEVKLYASYDRFLSAQENIHKIFTDIDTCFSPESENYSSPIVLSLFRKASALHQASSGAFDITVAPFSKLWGFFDGNHRVPESELIQNTLKIIGMEKVVDQKTFLDIPEGMSMDWGGIAKGYGIDLAAQRLKESGIAKGFINAGGDLYCWGKNPSNSSWKIGIKHPRKEGFLGVLEIQDMGAATAGDYQRFFIRDGIRYHHIFNPKTGYPAQGKQSVTVVGPEALLCDALSTALFVMSYPEELLQKYPEYGAVIVDSNGNLSILGKEFPLTLSGY